MTQDEAIAELLRCPKGAGRYELVVRAGMRYEHPWRRVVLGVVPLIPVGETTVLSLFGANPKPMLRMPVWTDLVRALEFECIPLVFAADESIMVTLVDVEGRVDYFGAAVLLVCT